VSQTTIPGQDIGSHFELLLGSQAVASDSPTLERHAVDGVSPNLVLMPENAEQIAAILRLANERNQPIVPFGGGTRQHLGRIPETVGIVVSTERIKKIEAYDPGDLTISVQAGATLAQLRRLCSDHHQFLPIEAPAGSTVGGSLAAASCGPLRAGFGGLRDFCIGISFVSGDGVSGRGGGRVVKNVAGYDLMKLMIGSFGTLGIISAANFKLFPSPEQTLTCLCHFESLAQAFSFRDWLLRSPLSPISVEIIGPEAAEYFDDAEPRNPDEWAPEHRLETVARPWQMAVRFSGTDRTLARCRREVASWTAREMDGSTESEFWNLLLEFETRVMSRHRNAMIFHLEVPIAESIVALESARTAAGEYNFVTAIAWRATAGSFVVAFLPLAIDPPSVMQFAGAASDLRSRLSRDCSAVVVRCPREAKQHFDTWGSTPTDIELMKKIKRALDPKGILNRGRFLIG